MSPKLTRRQIFKSSLLAVILAPATYLLSTLFGRYTVTQFKNLNDKQAAIFKAIAETIVPPDNALKIPLEDMSFESRLDEFIDIMPEFNKGRVKLLLWVVEHIMPLRLFYFTRFTRLRPNDRLRLFKRFEESGSLTYRSVIKGVKALVLSIYFNNPAVESVIDPSAQCKTS